MTIIEDTNIRNSVQATPPPRVSLGYRCSSSCIVPKNLVVPQARHNTADTHRIPYRMVPVSDDSVHSRNLDSNKDLNEDLNDAALERLC